jgi:hypothetical protein
MDIAAQHFSGTRGHSTESERMSFEVGRDWHAVALRGLSGLWVEFIITD